MYMAMAVTVIVIVFFLMFHKQIIGLFPRVKSIGKINRDSDHFLLK